MIPKIGTQEDNYKNKTLGNSNFIIQLPVLFRILKTTS